MKTLTDADVWAANLQSFEDDIDLLNEANFETALQIIANRTKNLYDHKGWIDQANTWSAAQTVAHDLIANGQSGDANAAIKTTSSPSSYKLLWESAGAGTIKNRIFAADGLYITRNAYYSAGAWQRDDVTNTAELLTVGGWTGTANGIWVQTAVAAANPIAFSQRTSFITELVQDVQHSTHSTSGTPLYNFTELSGHNTIQASGADYTVTVSAFLGDVIECEFACGMACTSTLVLDTFLSAYFSSSHHTIAGTDRIYHATSGSTLIMKGRYSMGSAQTVVIHPRAVVAGGSGTCYVSGSMSLTARVLRSA